MFGLFKPQTPITNLSPAEVHTGLQTKTLLLIDVRQPSEFEAEHIEGAVNLPLSRLSSEALQTASPRQRRARWSCSVWRAAARRKRLRPAGTSGRRSNITFRGVSIAGRGQACPRFVETIAPSSPGIVPLATSPSFVSTGLTLLAMSFALTDDARESVKS